MKIDRKEWNIEELEQFFNSSNLPSKVKLSFGTITAVPKFIKAHLSYIKANKQKRTFKPYLERLILLMRLLNN
jgi:hypothetical protein